MRTLNIIEECPKKRKLKTILRAAQKQGYNRLKFIDTLIFLKPKRMKRTKGIVKTYKHLTEYLSIQRTFYSILIHNEEKYFYVGGLNDKSNDPIWKSPSYIKASYNQIHNYYSEKGFDVTLMNEKNNELLLVGKNK